MAAGHTDREFQRIMKKEVADWSVADVGLWLEHSGLQEWKLNFINESVSGAELVDLTSSDLRDIGLSNVGDRKTFMRQLSLLLADKSGDKPLSFESRLSAAKPSSSATSSSKKSSAAVPDDKLHVKLYYRSERESVMIEQVETLKELQRRVSRVFGKRLALFYRDPAGDAVELKRDRDWRLAKRSMTGKSIRIKCSARTRADEQRSAELQAINNFANPAIMTTEAGVIVDLNPAAEEFFGFRKGAIIGSKVNILMPDEYAEHHDRYLQNYISTGVRKVMGIGRRVKAVKRDGTITDVFLTLSETRTRKDRHFIGTLQDISQGEASLITVDQTEHFTILQSLLDPAIVINDRGIVQFYNPAAAELFGYPATRVIGRNINMLMQGKERREHDSYLANYLRTGKASVLGKGREVVGANSKGELVPLYLQVTEQKLNNQSLFTGICRSLQQSAPDETGTEIEKIRDVLETLLIAAVVINEEGVILFVNPAAEELLGVTLASALTKNVSMLMPDEYAQHHDGYLQKWRATGEGTVFGVGRVLPAKHGQTGAKINVRLSVSKRLDEAGKWICIGTLSPI